MALILDRLSGQETVSLWVWNLQGIAGRPEIMLLLCKCLCVPISRTGWQGEHDAYSIRKRKLSEGDTVKVRGNRQDEWWG